MKLNTSRNTLAAAVASATLLGGMALSAPSQALEYQKGDWLFNVDTTLGYSAQWRTENRDDDLEAIANSNDGNNNFDDGDMTSSKANVILELGGEKGEFSFFIRADALYDYIYEDGDSSMSKENYLTYNAAIPRGGDVERGDFPDDTLDEQGTRVRLLDAFAQYGFNIGDQSGSIKVGRQIITWGGATFYPGISGLQNPADGSVAVAPGVEAKEIFLPTNAVNLKWDFTESISAEAYYKLEWKETTQPGVGSYLSTSDFTGPGAERILLDPLPVDGKAGGSNKPGDDDQWGAAFRYMTEEGWTAELAYAESHANLPGALTVIDFADFSNSYIEEVYEEDIPSWSFTFTGNIGEASVYADVYYSDDMPFVDLTPQLAGSTFIQSDITRDDYWQVTVGMWDVYTRFKWLSEQIDFRAEAIYQWNDLGESDLDDTPYTVTEDAWGYQISIAPVYYNVIQGLDMNFPIAFRHDVSGYGNAIALGNGLEEDQKRASITATGNYLTNWQVSAVYAWYFDEKEDGEYLLKDRDNFTIRVKYRF